MDLQHNLLLDTKNVDKQGLYTFLVDKSGVFVNHARKSLNKKGSKNRKLILLHSAALGNSATSAFPIRNRWLKKTLAFPNSFAIIKVELGVARRELVVTQTEKR